jgi:hypothetical protein
VGPWPLKDVPTVRQIDIVPNTYWEVKDSVTNQPVWDISGIPVNKSGAPLLILSGWLCDQAGFPALRSVSSLNERLTCSLNLEEYEIIAYKAATMCLWLYYIRFTRYQCWPTDIVLAAM